MARNPFILYGSNGSVGNVTTYKREGVQVTREKTTQVANPRTTGQAQQRNYLAPVARFFAPLAVALEQSYEGLSKSKSYTAFLKENIARARNNGWYLTKGSNFYPLPYKLSRGTISPVGATFNDTDNAIVMDQVASLPNNFTWSDFSQAVIDNYGAQDGDQITLILIKAGIGDNAGEFYPSYERAYLDTESTATMAQTFSTVVFSTSASGTLIASNTQLLLAAGAVIVSRYENQKWRRSTEILACSSSVLAAVTGETAMANAIASYQTQVTTPTSDVYLNGSTSQGAGTGGIMVTTKSGAQKYLTGVVVSGGYLMGVSGTGNVYFLGNNIKSESNGHYLTSKTTSTETKPSGATDANTVTFALIGEDDGTYVAAENAVGKWLLNQGCTVAVIR